MKITRYIQSCFLVETNKKRILIDPGKIGFDEKFLEEWTDIDAILVTHKHGDHCHEEAVNSITERDNASAYSTKEVQDFYPNIAFNIIKSGDVLDLDEVKIEVVDAVHGFIPKLREMDIEIKENVGYIIDDGETRFYHTSDTVGFPNDYECDVMAIPVNNHGLCFGAPDAAMFAESINPQVIIPCHYDNPVFPADIEAVKKSFAETELDLHILEVGDTLEFPKS